MTKWITTIGFTVVATMVAGAQESLPGKRKLGTEINTDEYREILPLVRHAYFLGANDLYSALKTTLKAEIDSDAWATLNRDTSRTFHKPKLGRIAVKVINHLGDEEMKVFKV